MRALRKPASRGGAGVSWPPLRETGTPLVLPEACACCFEPPSHRVAVAHARFGSLLVGYCDECAEHQSSSAARELGLGLASLLLGLALAAALPLVWPRLSLIGLLLAVGFCSALPLGALLLPRRAPHAPHSARGPAVFSDQTGELCCSSSRYAECVAELNGGALRARSLRERRPSAWLCAGPLLALGAAWLSFLVFHPLLRILNLGPERAEVALDGQRLTFVDPTSNESPRAGALLRVPAGAHTLVARSAVDGAELERVSVELRSGSVHLFAIGAEGTCFWLETTGYGREQRAAPSFEVLRSGERFWVLPAGIDGWFAPNPPASDANSRSSGGLLTALRQAPCAEAPEEVRSAL